MTFPQWLLLLIVILPLIPVILNRLRIDIAALLMAVSLGIFQFLGFSLLGPAHSPADALKAISGFSEPVVITLLSLFILTRGLEKSGGTRWLTHWVLKFGQNSESRLIMALAGLSAGLSLFMNNLAAGALVLPVAMDASRRSGVRPSKLLIPVAYGSLLGGTATYFTTANIIMSNLLTVANPPQSPLGILDFTPTGGLIALAGLLYLGFFGRRLLPDRGTNQVKPGALRPSAVELEKLYAIGERLWEATVRANSPLIGKTVEEAGIGEQFGLTIASLESEEGFQTLPSPGYVFQAKDIFLLVGREEKVAPLADLGLKIVPEELPDVSTGTKFFQHAAYMEVILSPHSSLAGRTLKQIDFRQKFGVSVLALKRGSRSYRTDVGDIPLQMGDSLLAIGKRGRLATLRADPDLILLEPSESEPPVNRRRAILSILLITAGIAASIAGVPIYLSVLAAAVLSLLLGITPVDETYQAVEWQAIFLIAGMYAVSIAMVQTGLAKLFGQIIISLTLPFGGLGLAAGAFLLTGVLTQFLGGQVASLVTGPITISAAISLGVNPQAVAVATAIGCSATFLTPLAHPVNILMIAPGNYRFADFFRTGWVLTILSFILLLVGMILFWRL